MKEAFQDESGEGREQLSRASSQPHDKCKAQIDWLRLSVGDCLEGPQE